MRAQGRCQKKQEKEPGSQAPRLGHFCPQCGQFQALRGGVVEGEICSFRGCDSLRP